MEKYGILSPWYNNWDLRILQDLNHKAGKKMNTVQLSIDSLNFHNVISNGKWGVSQIPTTTQPIGVSVSAPTRIRTYSFDGKIVDALVQDLSIFSVW